MWLREKYVVEMHVSPGFPVRDLADAVAEAIPGTVAIPGPGDSWEFRVR